MSAIGKTRWAIPEGYIPSGSVSQDRALLSHETACLSECRGSRRDDQAVRLLHRSRAGDLLGHRWPPGARCICASTT